MRQMDIEYDQDTDAAFIWLGTRPTSQVIEDELWPAELKGHIGLLFDSDRRLIGLEVLFASEHLPGELLQP
jgi:uncharacterized protein YuzE